jgi:hypothetical protein
MHEAISERSALIVYSLSGLNLVVFLFNLFAVWVLASTFAAGLVWWAGILLLIGFPLALVSAGLAVWLKRWVAVFGNGLLFVAYTVFWLSLFLSRS